MAAKHMTATREEARAAHFGLLTRDQLQRHTESGITRAARES
jgi:hypothetical protein